MVVPNDASWHITITNRLRFGHPANYAPGNNVFVSNILGNSEHADLRRDLLSYPSFVMAE